LAITCCRVTTNTWSITTTASTHFTPRTANEKAKTIKYQSTKKGTSKKTVQKRSSKAQNTNKRTK
jgi:hypothetical protein